MHRFVKLLTQRRLLRDIGPERQRMELTQLISRGIKGWHGVKIDHPDWSDYSHSVALSAQLPGEGLVVYFIFNSYWEALEFELPVTANDKISGTDGSILTSIRRRISSSGKQHQQFWTVLIGRGLGLSWFSGQVMALGLIERPATRP